jgi:hypothetical protein
MASPPRMSSLVRTSVSCAVVAPISAAQGPNIARTSVRTSQVALSHRSSPSTQASRQSGKEVNMAARSPIPDRVSSIGAWASRAVSHRITCGSRDREVRFTPSTLITASLDE